MTTPNDRIAFFLEQLSLAGLSPEDLLNVPPAGATGEPGRVVPTVAEYVESTAARYKERTRRTYGPYWRFFVTHHGDRRLDELDSDDLTDVVADAGRRARRNRPGCSGRSAEESCVAALRALYRRAEQARLVAYNPAASLTKPDRLPNRRRALTEAELTELWDTVARVSGDPALDLLLVRFHLETGARQAGALALRLRDLDLDRQTIWLTEKFGKEREQPVSATLLRALLAHAEERGSRSPDDVVLRYIRRGKNIEVGAPLSGRRYDHLFDRLRREILWAQRMGLSCHVLRHTAGTIVERLAGFAVARAFLGHDGGGGPTGIYTKASIHEVAAAVATLTGEPHPLAPS